MVHDVVPPHAVQVDPGLQTKGEAHRRVSELVQDHGSEDHDHPSDDAAEVTAGHAEKRRNEEERRSDPNGDFAEAKRKSHPGKSQSFVRDS